MKTLALAVLLLCTTALVAGPLMVKEGDLEPIHLLKIADGLLTVGVATTGYTTESSFRLDVQTAAATRTCSVRIIRVKRDEGKMMPQPLVVTYRLADLKIDPRFLIRIENPFCSEEH
jgi:hypothetical protein